MPGLLPAPAHLLEAIFAQTNKLTLEDRQAILRFLAGNEPRAVDEDSSSSSTASGTGPPAAPAPAAGSAALSTSRQQQAAAMDLDEPRPNTNAAGPSRNSRGEWAPSWRDLSELMVSPTLLPIRPCIHPPPCPPAYIVRTRYSQPIRQVLLHEERRIEMRPAPRPTAPPSSLSVFTPSTTAPSSAAHSASSSTGSLVDAPGRASTESLATVTTTDSLSAHVNNLMKSYTIIDQIIFEMDYTTGCWRKLRRRIRMATDRRNKDETPGIGGEASSSTGLLAARTFDPNRDPGMGGVPASMYSRNDFMPRGDMARSLVRPTGTTNHQQPRRPAGASSSSSFSSNPLISNNNRPATLPESIANVGMPAEMMPPSNSGAPQSREELLAALAARGAHVTSNHVSSRSGGAGAGAGSSNAASRNATAVSMERRRRQRGNRGGASYARTNPTGSDAQSALNHEASRPNQYFGGSGTDDIGEALNRLSEGGGDRPGFDWIGRRRLWWPWRQEDGENPDDGMMNGGGGNGSGRSSGEAPMGEDEEADNDDDDDATSPNDETVDGHRMDETATASPMMAAPMSSSATNAHINAATTTSASRYNNNNGKWMAPSGVGR